MFKKYALEIVNNIKVLIKIKKDILFVPVLGAVVYFLQEIMNASFNVEWVSDFNVWSTAFLTSVFLFMLFDLTLNKIPFFSKYNKLTLIISFFVSTFIGESISYSFKNTIQWWQWILIVLFTVAFFFALLFCIGIGASFGKEKAEITFEKVKQEYIDNLKNMSEDDHNIFLTTRL